RFADLIDALALAAERLPESLVVLMAGEDGGIGAALAARAAQAGVDDRIRWLGAVADIGGCLAAADIAVSASHEEGFSNAVLEYLAAGLAIVATRAGGTAEAVVDGESGLLVTPGNAAELADALVRLAGDAGLRARLGSAARERAQTRFTEERCVARYRALYAGLLRSPGASLPDLLDEPA
ncbi:MAG: glycosyltransferase family 4 protein, partial [Gammaproteobacteria bacterium]